MPLILGTNSIKDTGYNVANSCRFNDGDSAYMHKTPGSAGNQIAFTISLWCKRGTLGTKQTLFSAVNDANNETECHFETDDTLNFRDNEGGSWMIQKRTSQVFRDCSAWYHLVFSSVSGTQKIWVNGVEVTSWHTNTNGTGTATWNDDNVMTVGAKNDGSSPQDYFDGYIAEFVSIDGSTLTPTSFGEFDEDSPTIWKPIDVSGLTFGTNGFYLDFEDSSNLGNDANGGTDLTEVNLAAVDQATDTPTNNFCTLNPVITDATYNNTFTEGNMRVVTTAAHWTQSGSTIGITAGKWYWEGKYIDSNDPNGTIGVKESAFASQGLGDKGGTANGYNGTIFSNDGYAVVNNTNDTGYGSSWSGDDIISVAFDADNMKIYFAINGTWQDSGDPTSGATGTGAANVTTISGGDNVWLPFFTTHKSAWEANFGGCPAFAISSGNADGNGYGNFEYAPPSGFLALCTKNLGSDGG